MDSAIIIFIITILQIILDCHGISLRGQGRRLQTHSRRLNNPDDFRIPRRSNNFYAGMGSLSQPIPPPEKENKLGVRISRFGNSKSITYGENLDKTEDDFYPEYRRAIAPQNPKPISVILVVLLRKEKRSTPEEDRYRLYLQNDRRSPELYIRQTRPTNYDYTEQKRAINSLELPIHYVKDYHKIELEMQKREAENSQKQAYQERTEILPSTTTTATPIDYSLQSYDRFKEEMMQMMQDEDRSIKKETLMPEYESQQNKLYNNYYENGLPNPRAQYPQTSGQSQDIQFPRPQIQDAPDLRPQAPNTILVPEPQVPDTILVPRPQVPDTILVPGPQVPDVILEQRPQVADPPPIQFQDTEALSQYTPDQQSKDPKFDEEIYNSFPNWRTDHEPLNLAALGIKFGEENYNWQALNDQLSTNFADQSSANLADQSSSNLVDQLLENLVDQSSPKADQPSPNLADQSSANLADQSSANLADQLLENLADQSSANLVDQSSANLADMSVERLVCEYHKLEQEILRRKKVLESYKKSLTQRAYSEKYKKPEYSQNYKFFQPSPSSPSSTPSPSDMSGLRNPPGRSGLPGPSNSPGLPGPPDSLGLPGSPASPGLLGPPDSPGLPDPPDSPGLPGPLDSPGPLGPSYSTRPSQRPVVLKESGEETTESYLFNPDVEKEKVSGPKPPTGIISYPSRKSLYVPDFDQIYIIYLRRIRPRKNRHKHKPIAAYQYAYVNLEQLENVIKKFRRQRAGPQVVTVDKKKNFTRNAIQQIHDEPEFSSDVDDTPQPAQDHVQSDVRFFDTGDTFNHIKIDPEAPDMKDFMPKAVFEDNGDKWWFYHQADYNPFRD